MFPELEKALVDLFKASVDYKSITGATTTDPRIYAWFPTGDIIFTPGVKDVATIYRFSITGRPGRWSYPSQIGEMQLFLRVSSIDQAKLGLVTEILIGENSFLDKKSIQTEGLSVKWIVLLSANDGLNEGAPTQPIHVRNISFRFSNVFIRE
jgi:hypothetical protein